MSRTFTLILTGLCVAPLFAFAGFGLSIFITGEGGGSDTAIANGVLALVVGIVVAIVGGIVTARLAARFVPPKRQYFLLIGDGALFCIWIAALSIATWEPSELRYEGSQALLEAEIRVEKTAYGRDAVGTVYFNEGMLDSLHSDSLREEGDYFITPWDTVPYKVRSWNIDVMLNGHQKWIRFPVDLPARPQPSTDWSDWQLPIPAEDHETPEGIGLRYRFRLVPYGSS